MEAVPGSRPRSSSRPTISPTKKSASLAELAANAGADFVKTSTGFAPTGATVEDVKLLYDAVGDRIKVKASGGIRTTEQALALLEAGASRIGASNAHILVDGLRES